MDFHQLEYAVAVADSKSLTKAANKLHLSASALSQHLKKLEKEYNTVIFERGKSAWHLTEPGKLIIGSFREMLRIQNETLAKVDHLTITSSGGITLGLLSTWTVPVFSSIFPMFHKRYPNVNIYPHREEAASLITQLAYGWVDLAFLVGFGKTPWARQKFSIERLGDEELVLVLPKDRIPEKYVSSPSSEADLRDFRDEHYYLGNSTTVFRQLENEAFQGAGYVPLIASESVDLNSLESLLVSGFGPSFLLSCMLRPSEEVQYFMPVPRAARTVYAVCRQNHILTPQESCLIDLAKQYYAVDPLKRTQRFSPSRAKERG